MGPGAQCVRTSGTQVIPRWSANSWDIIVVSVAGVINGDKYEHNLWQALYPAIQVQGLVQFCWMTYIAEDQSRDWLTAVTLPPTTVVTLRILLLSVVRSNYCL